MVKINACLTRRTRARRIDIFSGVAASGKNMKFLLY
jgi:hypothetical protein